jgi:hypothetical protein
MNVGFPAFIKLYKMYGQLLRDAFDTMNVYHVGSSVKQKNTRDVDVVVMLEDLIFEKMFDYATPEGPKWEAYCFAFSCLGKEVTGLNIDFKIQPVSWANEKFKSSEGHLRSAMIGFWNPK